MNNILQLYLEIAGRFLDGTNKMFKIEQKWVHMQVPSKKSLENKIIKEHIIAQIVNVN